MPDLTAHPTAADPIDATLLAHVRSAHGCCSHAELDRVLTSLGYDREELDRSLVRAERAGLLHVDVGNPPSTATRMATEAHSGA